MARVVQNENRPVLYLRWRPRTFEEVVGQRHITQTLRNAVQTHTVPHSLLFCGPRGTGKTSLARILFKAMNCPSSQEGEPCNRCSFCEEANRGRAMDLIEIDAASNRGIDEIRDLRERVGYLPAVAKRKLYIIDEAHQLTQPAWDAFLKTMEEPPSHVAFTLCTTEAHKIPATIVSRCQRFDFWRLTLPELEARLEMVAKEEGVSIERAALLRIARAARGGLRDALSVLDQLIIYADGDVREEHVRGLLALVDQSAIRAFLTSLGAGKPGDCFLQVAGLTEQGIDPRQFLEELQSWLRVGIELRLGAEEAARREMGEDELRWLRAWVESFSADDILQMLKRAASVDLRGRDPLQAQVQLELAAYEMGALLGSEPAYEAPPPGAESLREDKSRVLPADLKVEAAGASVNSLIDHEAKHPEVAEVGAQGLAPLREVTPAQVAVPPDKPFSLSEVRGLWDQAVDVLLNGQGLLATHLVDSEPMAVKDSTITVRVAHDFHRQALEDPASRRVVEEVLSAFFGRRCILAFVTGASQGATESGEKVDTLGNAVAELFGGRLEDMS